MLILERKSGQEVRVDGPATIRVVRRSGRIYLLIEASQDVSILRGELAERLLAERRHDPVVRVASIDGAPLDRIDREAASQCGRCGSCGTILPPPMPRKCPVCSGQVWRDFDRDFDGSR
jgi:sRNA-binding carbon storage regulator CsrA